MVCGLARRTAEMEMIVLTVVILFSGLTAGLIRLCQRIGTGGQKERP